MISGLPQIALWIAILYAEMKSQRSRGRLDLLLIFAAGWFLSDSPLVHQLLSGMASGAANNSGGGT